MAVSRFFILQRSKELREGELPSFRGYKEAAKAKLYKEYGWLESEKTTIQRRSISERRDSLEKLNNSRHTR